MTILCYIALFAFSAISLSCWPKFLFVAGFQTGESISTEVVVNGSKRVITSKQVIPKFGTQWDNSPKRFKKMDMFGQRGNEEETDNLFSFQFEDGLWALPTLSLTKKSYGQQTKFLESMVIQFVITKSGIGQIHAVTLKDVVYSTQYSPHLYVKYKWIEENAVLPSTGHATMFLIVFLFAIFALLVSCGGVLATGSGSKRNHSTLEISCDPQVNAPKWD